MKFLDQKKYFYKDLTALITLDTVIFPGDPKFEFKPITTLGAHSAYTFGQIRIGNHTGTHIDFPAHVLKNGKVSSDYGLESLMGEGIILEVPPHQQSINKTFILDQNILENDFVFFKTSNVFLCEQGSFSDKYVYIEPEAADVLVHKKIRVVGIDDYISVDT